MKKARKAASPKFQIYPDKQGQYRWRLVAANGRIIAQGESHTRKRDVVRAIQSVIAATSEDDIDIQYI